MKTVWLLSCVGSLTIGFILIGIEKYLEHKEAKRVDNNKNFISDRVRLRYLKDIIRYSEMLNKEYSKKNVNQHKIRDLKDRIRALERAYEFEIK